MNLSDYRLLLQRRGLKQFEVAAKLGISNGWLSALLTGREALPEDFEARFLAAVDAAATEKAARLLGEPVGAGK